jgi:hypothetical protein
LGVGEQDDLEEHGGWVCGSTRFIVVEARIKPDRSSSWSSR